MISHSAPGRAHVFSEFLSGRCAHARLFGLLLLILLGMTAAPAHAAIEWPQLKFTRCGSVTKPVQITHAGDDSGRTFLVSTYGKIYIYQDGQVLTTPFLDIADRLVMEWAESGLFSMAF